MNGDSPNIPKDKHTPGPWVVRTVPTSCGQCHKVGPESIVMADHGGICLYDDHTSLNPHRGGEQLANAHLIAAAPDLVNALRAAVEVIGTWHNMEGPGAVEVWPIYLRSSPEMKPIRDALSKAGVPIR